MGSWTLRARSPYRDKARARQWTDGGHQLGAENTEHGTENQEWAESGRPTSAPTLCAFCVLCGSPQCDPGTHFGHTVLASSTATPCPWPRVFAPTAQGLCSTPTTTFPLAPQGLCSALTLAANAFVSKARSRTGAGSSPCPRARRCPYAPKSSACQRRAIPRIPTLGLSASKSPSN